MLPYMIEKIPTPMSRKSMCEGDPVAQESGRGTDVGALMIRIGCWGILYHSYIKEPPKPYSNY